MKKIALILLGIAVLLTSCKPKDKFEIKYNGDSTVNIVLTEEYDLDITSEDNLTFYSDNELVVTVTPNGVIKGKNIGEANITASNSQNSITIKIVVSLFEEPTFNFYCKPSYIEDLYGTPRHKTDSLFVYGSGEEWYSFAVWEMDFFFIDKEYVEADLYIRKDLEIRIDEYLNNKFFYRNKFTDTDSNITYDIYLNDENPENATVLVGKIKDAGPYQDICLFYIPYEHTRGFTYDDVISRDRTRK